MPIAHNLGFPPLGAGRELKRATESYWNGKVARDALLKTGAELRARHWRLQQAAGLDLVPSNDFSYYDRMLDICALVGRSEEHTSELQSPCNLVCRLLLEKKNRRSSKRAPHITCTRPLVRCHAM